MYVLDTVLDLWEDVPEGASDDVEFGWLGSIIVFLPDQSGGQGLASPVSQTCSQGR